MDILTNLLETLNVRCYTATGTSAPAHFAIRHPGFDGIKLFCVRDGTVFITPSGESQAVELGRGDTIVLFRPGPFVFATDLSAPVRNASELRYTVRGGLADFGGDAAVAYAGKIRIDTGFSELFYAAMPGWLRIRAAGSQILHLMQRIHEERQSEPPGHVYTTQRLADLILVEVLRHRLSVASPQLPGLFTALQDAHLSKALTALHAAPESPWTLVSLASEAGMSRSAFAERFTRLVGTAPVAYLTLWRIRLAAQRLKTTQDSVKTIAADSGFQSPAAFCSAFKRLEDLSPGAWRERAQRESTSKLLDYAPADSRILTK